MKALEEQSFSGDISVINFFQTDMKRIKKGHNFVSPLPEIYFTFSY